MNTVQRDSCVLLSDYKQLIENGIPPGRGVGKTEAWCRQGRSLSPGKRFHLSFVRQGLRDSGSVRQMLSRLRPDQDSGSDGRMVSRLRPDQDCLALYAHLLFKPKLHVGTSKMDLTSLFVPLSNAAILNKVLLPPLFWFLLLIVGLIDPLRISSFLGLPTPGSDFNNIKDTWLKL